MSNIDDEFDVEPERVTKLKTSSEIARQRALYKIGKNIDWYNQQVDASLNEHGEATCAECKKPESKKLPNGRIKQLTIDTKNARLVCTKCSDRAYRQAQKDKVNSRNDRDGVPTLQQFWVRNRNKLSEAEKVQSEARHDELIGLFNEMQLCNTAFEKKVPFNEAALCDFIREVCREVVEYGTVQTDITVVPFFKPEYADFYQSWTNTEDKAYDKALALYMTCGYVSALPQHAVYPFFEHVERHLGLPISLLETFLTRVKRIYDVLDFGKVWKQPDQIIKCETKGCSGTTTIPPNETPPAQWWCAPCQAERDKKAHAAHSHIIDVHLEERRNDAVNDEYGRPKDKPLWLKDKIWGRKAEPDRNTIFSEDGEFNG